MFYIRKPSTEKVNLLRVATAAELHNYKNRFVIQPPTTEPEQEPDTSCNRDCNGDHSFDEMLFININCDLGL